MAPELGLHASGNSFGPSPLPNSPFANLSGRQRYFGKMDIETMSNIDATAHSVTSRRVSRKLAASESTKLTETVSVLQRRSNDELGAATSAKLLTSSYNSLLDWIKSERMAKLPAEGSHYDQLLGWVLLFANRLHSFDLAIEHFASDSYLAAQLAYGYCAVLLELGEENSHALMIVLGFFYSISLPLVNILDRAELFSTSPEIRDQLILAFSDLATLVASVATHFHKALSGLSSAAVSIDLYTAFSGPIESFRNRCDRITEDMWKYEIIRETSDMDKIPDINLIKQWLAPEDWVIANIAGKASVSSHRREELTCLWIRSHLTRFLNSTQRGLSITGRSGCGKSVLASVILQHLQQSIAGKSFRTIHVVINRQTLVQASPLAVVKSLLFQLFHQRIGSVQLYQILDSAYTGSKRCADKATYEKLLWTALEDALAATQPTMKELVVIVDGIDETTGDADWLLKRLHNIVSKSHHVKLITLSSHDTSLTSVSTLKIDADLNFDDVAAVVRSALERDGEYFPKLPVTDQEIIVDTITRAADASFLWAKLVTKLSLQDDSVDAFVKRIQALEKAKTSIQELVWRHIQLANLHEDSKHALVWLATAERPLSQREVAALLSIDTHKATFSPRDVNVLSLLKPVNSLIYTHDGLISIRHVQVRDALRDLIHNGKLGLSFKDGNGELVRRLFIYMNSTINVDEHVEPSLTSMDRQKAVSLCDKHLLLEYALRYWVVHISKVHSAKIHGSDITLPKELAAVFPSSVTIALLEMTLWERMSTPTRISWHGVVTNLRRCLLSDKHLMTLQSIITLSLLYRDVGDLQHASEYSHIATVISKSVLNVQHFITMKMCTFFLEVTSTMVSETKTETMTHREEVLISLIECYKIHYGETSEMVISTQTQLAEHYQLIKEEQRAKEIFKHIQQVTTVDYDAGSTEGRDFKDHLNIQLRRRGRKGAFDDEIDIFEDTYGEDEVIETTEFDDYEALIKLAAEYATAGKHVLAEQVYIEIWQRSSQQCRVHQSSRWEIRKIEAVLAYAHFLKAVSRELELNILLTSLWHEYESSTVTISEVVVTKLFQVAKYMKTVSMASAALKVFKYCATHYESTSRTETTSIYKEIQEEVRSTTTELTKHAASSSTSITISESAFEEILYAATSSTSTTTITETTITAILSRTQVYISQHRWHAACNVLKKVIDRVWPEFLTSGLDDVSLPKKHIDGCVELALRLGQCYYWIRRPTMEEDIRVRLYRVFKSVYETGDKRLESRIAELLDFYKRTSQTDKIISLRQDCLSEYIKHYGQDHKVVIEHLYILAELTRPRPIFVDYYKQIVSILNKNSDVCKAEAVEPLIILAGEYWSQGRYLDSLSSYEILFHTFLHSPKTHRKMQDTEFIRIVYQRYVHCLRSTSTEITTIRKATQEFLSACKTTFGATDSITIHATLMLAHVCQESRGFILEAIALYEELLAIKSTEIDHAEIRGTLDAIYEEQAKVMTTETMTSTQVDRAVSVLERRITTIRSAYGWAHEESLSLLKETINFYVKTNKVETAVKELRESTVNILSEEISTTKLIAAATTIASGYIACKQTQKAIEFCEHIYQALILRDDTSMKEIKVDIASRHAQGLVILAQLEYMLRRESTTTFNEIIAALSMEYSYYEEYRKYIAANASFEAMIVSVAQLYTMLHKRRAAIAQRLLADFVNHFLRVEGKKDSKKISKSQAHEFVYAIINYFSTRRSQHFFRSVHLAVNSRVQELIQSGHFKEANELSLGAFYYLSSYKAYRSPPIILYGLSLGTMLGGRGETPVPHPKNGETRAPLLEASRTILQHLFGLSQELRINLGRLPLERLNGIIGVIGELKDYKNLNWLLGILWNSREVLRNWPASSLSALGARYILSRFMVGELAGAVRLAEDIVYNLRRVRGPHHPSTLDMTTLLGQLYINIGNQYQGQTNGQRIARSYYKKAATLHENVLRSFNDPSDADYDGSEVSVSWEGGDSSILLGQQSTSSTLNGAAATGGGVPPLSEGDYVRKHLDLMKLAIQRYGDWPKEYDQYLRLNADVFRTYSDDLKGMEGVEKWKVKEYGSGKAEADFDTVDTQFSRWELEGLSSS